MKKLIAVTLLALVCWAIPINWIWAKTTDKPKQKVEPTIIYEKKVEEVTSLNNETQLDTPPKPKTEAPRPIQKTGYSGRHYSPIEVQQLIRDYSAQYGINPDVPLCIARLESGYNQFSKNKTSSASGVFQYLSSTWNATDEGKAGLSVFDADANIRAAIRHMAIHKSVKPWVVWPRCPSLN